MPWNLISDLFFRCSRGTTTGLGDISGLVKSIQDAGIGDVDWQKRLSEGVFTLRDMYEQFENINKLGPLNSVRK